MSDTQLTLTIPESDNLPWFNNFIAAILYSHYSRELILNNEDILDKLKEIFNFTNDTKKNLEEIIRIVDSKIYELTIKISPYVSPPLDNLNNLNYLNEDNEANKIKELNVNNLFYNYLLSHDKELTAFILPKFLELINSSCISVERYHGKNYIGLFDLIKYEKKPIFEKRLFGMNKKQIGEEDSFELKDIKQREIKKIYHEPKDYILINKWNNKNIPDIFKKVSEKDQDGDEDGIDNKYRLSSTYKNKEDLDITDKIDDVIIYNGYYYKLDSCIISDNNTERNSSQLLTFLTHKNKKYVYLDAECTKLHELKSYDETFSIYSKFPCELFKTKKININPDEKNYISTYDIKNSNYTLIYVKFKNIEIETKERKEAINRITKVIKKKIVQDDAIDKAQQAKKEIDLYRIDKIKKLQALEKANEELMKERDDEKAKYAKLDQTFKKLKKESDEDIDKNIKAISDSLRTINIDLPAPKKDDYINLIKLLSDEYIKILRNDDTENIKRFPDFESCIDKIREIQEEINNIKDKLREYKGKPDGRRATYEKNFIKSFDNIHMYLKDYIFFIIKLLSRQNTISLIKEEIKDLPNNARINEILAAISKLPNEAKLKKIEDLLTPTDAKLKQILEAIEKLPNDAKLKKIEDLLTPTDAKIAQILDTIDKMSKDDKTKVILDEIAKIPNEAKINDLFKALIKDLPKGDNTRELLDAISKMPTDAKLNEILDAISKMPKEDNKKLLQDLNAKIDAMQQDLLSKIQEQKSTNSRTIQPEIAELRRQIQLMGDIQKQLSEATKNDHTKIIETLNSKLDDMQQILMDKLQNMEIKKSSSSNDKITLQSEIASLNQQLKLLEDIQTKIAQSGERDNKQLLQDMQQELLKYSEKDNQKIISGVQDLLRLFNKEIVLKQNEKDVMVHQELERNIKEQLVLLKDIQSKLENGNGDGNNSNCKNENNLLKLENTELKQQIEILKDIQSKCKRQQQDYEKCNKHNMLPYKYIKFKEDELLAAIKDNFKGKGKQSDKIIIEFIFKYFEKNNKVMNVYLIEKYMGDIYDVMKIFNKKYNIDDVDIKQFYRLLASISIYAKFNEAIKKNIY